MNWNPDPVNRMHNNYDRNAVIATAHRAKRRQTADNIINDLATQMALVTPAQAADLAAHFSL